MKYSIFALIVLSLACTKKEAPAEAPAEESEAALAEAAAPETEPAVEDSQEAPPVETAPVIELIDAGKPPLRTLRWAFEPGEAQGLLWKSDYTFHAQRKGAEKQPIKVLPRMRQRLELSVVSVSDDGLAEVSYEALSDEIIKTPKVSPGVHITPAKGVRGTYKVDARGVVSEFSLSLPEGLNQDADLEYVENLLRLTVLPVPSEAVGVGAKWSVTREGERRGIPMKERLSVELIRAEGARVELAFELQSEGSRESEVAPRGKLLGVRFEEYSWNATGRLKTNLSAVVPKRADVDNELVLSSRFESPGNAPDQLDMKVSRELEMRATK